MDKTFKILIVDDEPNLLETISDVVVSEGYSPLIAVNGADALELVKKWHHELVLVISDLKMPEMDGITFRQKMLPEYQSIPFAVISGYIDTELAMRAVETKICHFINKPFTLEDVAVLIKKEAAPRAEELRDDLELLFGFLDETANMMEELESLILELQEDNQSIETINRIFGILHTIKGTSAFFSPPLVNKFSHKFEDFLTLFKNGEMSVNPDVIAIFLNAYDVLLELIEGLKNPSENQDFDLEKSLKIFDYNPEAKEASVEDKKVKESLQVKKAQDNTKDWVKTPLELLDQFMKLSGEITVIRNMVKKVVQNLEKTYVGDQNVKTLSELLEEMHLINSYLQADIMDLRKVSLKDVLRPISRSIRELSRALDKEVHLEITGDDLYVDTSISEILNSSLIHMIRNCMDHGIESQEERTQLGKSPNGTICLNAYQDQDEVKFEIKDDGRGMDKKKIAAKLIEKSLYTEEQLSLMSKEEIFETIFESGFSTAEQVTEVSGRGVGMDQVKSCVEKHHGRISVRSEISQGTQITLHLPLPKSVQIITSLTVVSNDQQFSIPRDAVDRVLQIKNEELHDNVSNLEGKKVLKYTDGQLVPLIELCEVFNESSTRKERNITNIVVIRTKKFFYGLLVDEIGDSEETVIKPLHKVLKGEGTFSSATFQGDGQPGLILDIDGIAEKYALNQFRSTGKLRTRRAAFSHEAEKNDYLVFTTSEQKKYTLPLCFVYRLEHFSFSELSFSSGTPVIRYRGKIIPVFDLDDALSGKETEQSLKVKDNGEQFHAIVVKSFDNFFAFRVHEILDTRSIADRIDSNIRGQSNILGNLIIDGQVHPVVDIWKFIHGHSKQHTIDAKKVPRRASYGPILYAENVDFYRNYISKGLSSAGYHVITAKDGRDALEKLREKKDTRFSILLTDLNMPECNGLELAKELQTEKHHEGLPIVALTAHSGKEEREQMHHLGFSAILPKLGVESVISQIDKMLAV